MPDVPVGFDLAHDAFQRALVLRGEPADGGGVGRRRRI